jgi:mannose-6-phosphate isomerase-like protein (cupin superfamily)
MEKTSQPPRTAVIRGSAARFEPVDRGAWCSGLAIATLVDGTGPARHLGTELRELAPGGWVAPHFHPYEESFFVLSGEIEVRLGDQHFAFPAGGFGLAPFGVPHAMRNTGDGPARLLSVLAPQPRDIAGTWPTFAAPALGDAAPATRPDERDPACRHAGVFGEDDLSQPGSLSMPGYHGTAIKDVAVRMMVDETLGARQHTLFMVEFAPAQDQGLSAGVHYHAFEEIYYFVQGSARAELDGQTLEVHAGDLVWAGVGGSHGFTAIGGEPVRWIEAQSPLPPASNAFIFEQDWARLASTPGRSTSREIS